MSTIAVIPNYEERLQNIIYLSYSLLCKKIVGGEVVAKNEASIQHQLSLILKQIGQHYLFSPQDRFEITLEKDITFSEPPNKSPKKKARCDIWLTMSKLGEINTSISAAIEIKYFKRGERKNSLEATTDNRFALMFDLENLEKYRNLEGKLLCYEVVYTNNPNYANENTIASLPLAPTIPKECERTIQRRNDKRDEVIKIKQKVQLACNYEADWISYGSDKNAHHFLLVDLQRKDGI